MSILSRLALLFIGVPLLELFILIQIGQMVGLWPTIGLVVLTGMAGAALARREGLRTLWNLQEELGGGRLPGRAIMEGFAILVGGALLLTPGILTDVVGFSLLLPPTRSLFLEHLKKSLEERLEAGTIRVTHVAGFQGGGGFGFAAGGPRGAADEVGRQEEADEGEEDRSPYSSREIVVEPGKDGGG